MPDQNTHAPVLEATESPEQPEHITSGAVFRPDVDIIESHDEITLLIDLPGARPDAVDLSFERGVLAIAAPVAPRRPENARVVLEEYAVGPYQRTFRIGHKIDAASISAESRDGVLVVHLPKSAEARSRRIPVAHN